MQVTHATSQLLCANLSGSANRGFGHSAAGEVNDVDDSDSYFKIKCPMFI